MDLLQVPPPLNLYDRRWVIHTRTEERPPMRIADGAAVRDSMISDGCIIESGAVVERSVLSPGVVVRAGAVVRESVVLTDTIVGEKAVLEHAILDKRVRVERDARVGALASPLDLTMVGKGSEIPEGAVLEAGVRVGTDVIASDYPADLRLRRGQLLETQRRAHQV